MPYTEAQRAIAVEIIARHDGEVTTDALQEIRDVLQSPALPRMTVWRWVNPNRVTRKKPSKIVVQPAAQAEASKTLDQLFEEVANKYLEHALEDSVIEKTSGQASVIAAATAVDKMRLLRGLPTEIVSILPGLIEAITARGLDPVVVFRAFQDRLALPVGDRVDG